jgi:hypothetical protein
LATGENCGEKKGFLYSHIFEANVQYLKQLLLATVIWNDWKIQY